MNTGTPSEQHTPDYTLGYALGTRAAKRSPGLSDTVLTAKARLAFGRASRSLTLDREHFVSGYIAAYQQRRSHDAT